MSSAHAVVVVGGGIAGLVAATRMVAAGAEVTLLESSDRVGGSVRTAPFAGRALDMGAETVVTAQPEAVQLCEELGLGDDLVASGREPGFLTLRHGLGTLTGALAQTLLTAGADVRVATAATAVSPEASGGVTVVDEHGTELHADACIIATPARPAARMLAQSVPVAAAGLERLTASSVAVVALAYPATALHGLPAGTGFPTTSGQTRLVRAWTWSSAKWHHLAGELALVKAFIGRAGAPPPPWSSRRSPTPSWREPWGFSSDRWPRSSSGSAGRSPVHGGAPCARCGNRSCAARARPGRWSRVPRRRHSRLRAFRPGRRRPAARASRADTTDEELLTDCSRDSGRGSVHGRPP